MDPEELKQAAASRPALRVLKFFQAFIGIVVAIWAAASRPALRVLKFVRAHRSGYTRDAAASRPALRVLKFYAALFPSLLLVLRQRLDPL